MFSKLVLLHTHLYILYLSSVGSTAAIAKWRLAVVSGLMMEGNVVAGNCSRFTGAFDAAARESV